MAACDFFSIELLIQGRLVRCMVLFAIDLSTRKVAILGVKPDPNGVWMEQVARNLSDGFDGFLNGCEFLIHDRDPLFTRRFRGILQDSGINSVRLPRRSPNLNAYAERFVRSIKSECLDQMIFFSERSLRYAIQQYVEHYHQERNHQGLESWIIQHRVEKGGEGAILRRERLGGLLSFYLREAA